MKGKAVIVGLIVGLTILLLIYFFATRTGGPRYQWYPSFRSDNNQPYGLMFIHKMLKTYYEGEFVDNQKEPIYKLLEDERFNDGSFDYVLIGESIYLDSLDIKAMKKFMENGGDVFIATMEEPKALVDSIYLNTCDGTFAYDYTYDSLINANFYFDPPSRSTDYRYKYRMGDEDVPYNWSTVIPEFICDTVSAVTPLGYQQEYAVNFLSINYGAGRLFIHTSPLMFTNYFLTKEDKVEYASSVFSYLGGKNVIWDEVSKVPFSNYDNPYQNPLYFILQQPALKYAWWMFVAGVLLYVIFASKRTQRVIPVLEAKTNTSLEFLNVISSLHYQNQNHLDMARKKMKYFLYFIRAKYGISTQTLTEEQSKRLAERSKVDLADIQAITDRYKVIDNYSISNEEPERLIGLYQAIEKFYKTCK